MFNLDMNAACRRPLLTGPVLAILGALIAVCALPQAEAATSRIPHAHSPIPTIRVACLRKGTRHYVGTVDPGSCEIGGVVEASYDLFHGSPERLGRGGSFARFPITSTSFDVPGEGWGDYVTFGLGTNRRNRHEMNLTFYRRVSCPDGSAWYSRADVTDANRALVFYLRLPVCGYKVPPRKLASD
jgi:hypothetical protein